MQGFDAQPFEFNLSVITKQYFNYISEVKSSGRDIILSKDEAGIRNKSNGMVGFGSGTAICFGVGTGFTNS